MVMQTNKSNQTNKSKFIQRVEDIHRSSKTHARYVQMVQALPMPKEALPDLTKASPVPMLTDMQQITIGNNGVNQGSPSACSDLQNPHNHSVLLGFGSLNGAYETVTDGTVPAAGARAADAALSAYLRDFASSLACEVAS